MSVFTAVNALQLSAWLAQYALGPLVRHEGIAAGIENTNYFVTTSEGRYVLTLFEKLQPSELPFYLNLMAHLAASDVPCPAPVADNSGAYLGELNGKPAALVSRLTGKDIANPTVRDCSRIGAVMARMHIAGQRYTARMDNPRAVSWWTAARAEIAPFLNLEDAALLSSEIDAQADTFHADLPQGAIHADLFRDNVLFHEGEVAGIIDFYFACTGALAYDVAIAVNDWCLNHDSAACDLNPARTQALLTAYHAVRPFTPRERAAWPMLLRAGALRFWVSRLYDYHLPRPGEMTHAKDPGHFRRVLASHIANATSYPNLRAEHA